MEKLKRFLKTYKTGAIIGGIVGFGLGTWEILNIAWLQNLSAPGLFGVTGTFSLIVNVVWFVFLGAGLQWLLKTKLKLM